jgi:hypothetical protein
MSMLNYKAPLRDMRFVMNEVFDYPAHYRALGSGEDASPEVVDAILEAAATYCEEVLAPLYVSGGEEGCHFQAGRACRSPRLTAGRACPCRSTCSRAR